MIEDNLFDDIQNYLNGYEEPEPSGLFTDVEIQKIILSFAQGRGDKGFTDEEIEMLFRWASETVVAYSILELILKEEIMVVDISAEDGPSVSITDKVR